MKRYVAFAMLATLLAGCTSTTNLRSSKPTAAYAGSGNVGDIASCVAGAWDTKPVHLSSYEVFAGITIEIRQTENGPAVALVDIKPAGERTVATYYSNLDEDDTWYFEQVEHCMDTVLPKT